MIFFPAKGAFRVGYVNSTQWDNANVGLISMAMGESTTASDDYSTTMGVNAIASGFGSTALGYYTTAKGIFSKVIGEYNDFILTKG